MGKARAEVRPIDTPMPRALRTINILAAAAIELHAALVRRVRQPEGEQWLRVTEHTRTAPKVCAFELVEHLLEAAGGEDPACVDEAVEEAGLDVESRAEVILEVFVEVVGDEVEGLGVVLDFCV